MSKLIYNGQIITESEYTNHYVSGSNKEYGSIVVELSGTIIKTLKGSDLVCLISYHDYPKNGLTYYYQHISFQKDISAITNYDFSKNSVTRLIFIPITDVNGSADEIINDIKNKHVIVNNFEI